MIDIINKSSTTTTDEKEEFWERYDIGDVVELEFNENCAAALISPVTGEIITEQRVLKHKMNGDMILINRYDSFGPDDGKVNAMIIGKWKLFNDIYRYHFLIGERVYRFETADKLLRSSIFHGKIPPSWRISRLVSVGKKKKND